jgi:AcrR family transcriptional regulator
VFAHFGSREDLQLAVLDDAGRRFVEHVMAPALRAPRGVARLRALMDRWFDWARHRDDGGCIFLGAATEYDDRPGPLRDRVIAQMDRWRSELARAATLAIGTGELDASTDVEQLAFELYALALVVHHDAGLRGYDAAYARGMQAFDRLIRADSPA